MLVFVANEQLYPCTEVLLYVITELQLLALHQGAPPGGLPGGEEPPFFVYIGEAGVS